MCNGRLPLSVLLPQVVAKLKIPVVASGIATPGAISRRLLAEGRWRHCGTAFLASSESFAHDYHKQRIVAARPAIPYTDLFAINWPPNSPVRVLKTA